MFIQYCGAGGSVNPPLAFPSVEYPVAAATQAALEYLLFLPVGIQAGSGRAVDCPVSRAFGGVAAYGAGRCADHGSGSRTFGGALLNAYLLRVAFALLPVARVPVRVDALHIDYGVWVCRTAAGEAAGRHEEGYEIK